MRTFASIALILIALAPIAAALEEGGSAIKMTTRVRPDGTTATTVVDPDKRTEVETIADAGGKVMRKTLYTLDERNVRTGAIHYDQKDNIRYKEAYKRDADSRVTETWLYSKDDRLLGHRVYIYDAKGVGQVIDYDATGAQIVQQQPARPGRRDRRGR